MTVREIAEKHAKRYLFDEPESADARGYKVPEEHDTREGRALLAFIAACEEAAAEARLVK